MDSCYVYCLLLGYVESFIFYASCWFHSFIYSVYHPSSRFGAIPGCKNPDPAQSNFETEGWLHRVGVPRSSVGNKWSIWLELLLSQSSLSMFDGVSVAFILRFVSIWWFTWVVIRYERLKGAEIWWCCQRPALMHDVLICMDTHDCDIQ